MGHVKNSKLGLGSGWCWVGVSGWVNSGGELVCAGLGRWFSRRVGGRWLGGGGGWTCYIITNLDSETFSTDRQMNRPTNKGRYRRSSSRSLKNGSFLFFQPALVMTHQ